MNRFKSVLSSHVKLPSGFVTVTYIISNLEKLVIKISTEFLEIKYMVKSKQAYHTLSCKIVGKCLKNQKCYTKEYSSGK
jgi:hypothetical protein